MSRTHPSRPRTALAATVAAVATVAAGPGGLAPAQAQRHPLPVSAP